MELDELIQLTPVNSIKKNRKRFLKDKGSEKEEVKEIDENKTYETIGVFFFEKQTFVMQNNKRILLGMSLREKNQLQELEKSLFFNNQNTLKAIVDLNNEKSKTPRLRAYDWAVTNFSKTKRSCVFEENDTNCDVFDPYSLYVGELKKYHRLLFDPFRRGTHVYFEYNNSIQITTVGQLTFIKWCIENKIDKYVEEHYNDIKKNMTFMSKKRKLEKETSINVNEKQKKHHFIKNKNILKTGYYANLEI